MHLLSALVLANVVVLPAAPVRTQRAGPLSVEAPELRPELLAMRVADQEVRNLLIAHELRRRGRPQVSGTQVQRWDEGEPVL